MTSFYIEVARWGVQEADKRVVGLAASPVTMAQQPQVSLVNILSAIQYSVHHFHDMVMLHRLHHQQGNPNFDQPEDYVVREVTINKRFLWIQHETVVFQIRQNLHPNDPPFYLCVDRFADHSTNPLAFDRIVYLPERPILLRTRTIWTLAFNNNTFNLCHLAALLRATHDIGPNYRLSGHNCFWHTSATVRLIQEHILAGQAELIEVVEPPARHWQRFWFRRHACFGRRIGIPTDAEIDDIHHRYQELLAQQWIQPNQDI